MLADRTLRIPIGIVKNVYLHVGPHAFPIELVVMDMPHDPFCPIIFGRTFLNSAGVIIDCKQETISLKFGEEKVKFHFSKFREQPDHKDLNEKEGKQIAELAAFFLWHTYR